MNNIIFGSGVSSYQDSGGLKNVCSCAIDNDIYRFDTAPSYGTEEILSSALLDIIRARGIDRDNLYIQTKIDPIQMYNGDIEHYIEGKLKLMKLDYVDGLLIHWPVYKYFLKTWEELSKIKERGLARRIGICNLRIPHLKELKLNGIYPEIVQIERHPLNTMKEERFFCVDNNIELQDYSPLCKMHPLLKNNTELAKMALRYGRSLGAIILRWHLDTSAIPIFTSKNISRISDYSKINDFSLSSKDIDIIESFNINHKLYLESLICPGF